MKVQTVHRRLSTRYTMSLHMPAPSGEILDVPQGDDAQMARIAQAMLSDVSIAFSLQAPGWVIATNGQAVGAGKAEWKWGLSDLKDSDEPDPALTTEAPNWTNLGRLADQIAYAGLGSDYGLQLADALKRGLLPNPPANSADKLAAADYGRLLHLIGRLDAAGPGLAEAVVTQARLNRDDASAEEIQALDAKANKLDLGQVTQKAAQQAALRQLGLK